ncbi:hypothetical protein CRYUN_Cryun09bG0160200 [Craigia yunnanensis]
MLTKENVVRIGKTIRKLNKVEDLTWENRVERCFFRMRVAMEVAKPLVAGFWVPREGNSKVWAEVKYEKVTDFYFECGRFGHVLKNCEYGNEGKDMEVGRKRYGLQMKVTLIMEKEIEYRPNG